MAADSANDGGGIGNVAHLQNTRKVRSRSCALLPFSFPFFSFLFPSPSPPSAAHACCAAQVFTRWVNAKLSSKGFVPVSDIVDDLRSGEVLIQLVNVLTRRDLVKLNKIIQSETGKSADRNMRVHNVHSCLMFLGQAGLNLDSITAEALVDGKVTIALQFVWNTIVEFAIKPVLNLTRRLGVSQLCRQVSGVVGEVLKSYSVITFDRLPHDFRDGTVLAALMHRKDYKMLDFYGAIRDKTPPSELWAALMPLLELMGVPQILDVSDFAEMDESMFLTFFVSFWPVYQSFQPAADASSPASASDGQMNLAEMRKKMAALEAKLENTERALEDEQKAAETARQALELKLKHKDESVKLVSADMRTLELHIMEMRNQIDSLRSDNQMLRSSLEVIAAKEFKYAVDSIQNAVLAAPEGRCTLVYVTAENSMALWERAQKVMTEAMKTFQDLARSTAAQHHGYDASQESDTLVLAFKDIRDAVTFAMLLQLRLLEAPWPAALYELPELPIEHSITNQLLFQGLRAIVCIHTGVPIMKKSEVTGSVSYVGPVVLTTQLLGQRAHGGQTVLTESAWRELEPSLFALRITTICTPLGICDLGENRLMKLFALLPEQLKDRRFPALKSGTGDHDTATSPSSRKVILLQERNQELSNKLNKLSREVEESHSTVRDLQVMLQKMQYDVSGNTSEVLASFMMEMRAVVDTQAALTSKMDEAQADHADQSRRLQMIALSFEEEMRQARVQQKQQEEANLRLWREANANNGRRARQEPVHSGANTAAANEKLDRLNRLYKSYKANAERTEREMNQTIRSLRQEIRTLKRDVDVLAFKRAAGLKHDAELDIEPDELVLASGRAASRRLGKHVRLSPLPSPVPAPQLDHAGPSREATPVIVTTSEADGSSAGARRASGAGEAAGSASGSGSADGSVRERVVTPSLAAERGGGSTALTTPPGLTATDAKSRPAGAATPLDPSLLSDSSRALLESYTLKRQRYDEATAASVRRASENQAEDVFAMRLHRKLQLTRRSALYPFVAGMQASLFAVVKAFASIRRHSFATEQDKAEHKQNLRDLAEDVCAIALAPLAEPSLHAPSPAALARELLHVILVTLPAAHLEDYDLLFALKCVVSCLVENSEQILARLASASGHRADLSLGVLHSAMLDVMQAERLFTTELFLEKAESFWVRARR